MKQQPELDFLASLGIHISVYGTGEWRGRQVRYLPERGAFQIGEENFDRWANSVELEFSLWLPKGQRALARFVENTNKDLPSDA